MKDIFHFSIILFISILLVSCATETKNYTSEEISTETKKANDFFEKLFQTSMDRSPMQQTYLGVKKDYGKWDDLSPEFEAEELELSEEALQYLLDSINLHALDHQGKLSYKLLKADLENEIADFKWRLHNFPVNQMFGMHTQVPAFLINMHNVSDVSDAIAYISRLNGVPVLVGQLIDGLEEREVAGIIVPKFAFSRMIAATKNVIKGAPFERGGNSALFADFQSKVEILEAPKDQKLKLIEDAEEALIKSVKPAYEKLIAFMEGQEGRAKDNLGIWSAPEGETYYNVALQRTTTTDMTADDIHQTGLNEVARIHDEMREIMKTVSFKGDLQEFFIFMREDPQFYYSNDDRGRQAYLDRATEVIDNMKGRLDELFITKPKADMIVKRVEPFREKGSGKAFYQAPAPDGSRPGTYYANLANMTDMSKYELESLAYHEGIPGHHMDRSIAQELKDIPKFRKFGGYTAYVEGWGLYSEFIPKEMGLYQDPYSDYGRLAAELWRACRLVVDTGIHSKKWTREEGIKYYMDNTSNSPRDCERMVERHFVMPSQATAYKVGMLKILTLRAKAKDALGKTFDIKEFHEVVLTSGAVPLNVLEELIDEYIADTKAGTTKVQKD